ncbi:MAG: FliA/WhiG family RNA polymerase sigma factor [FCB group bacterium]|nr:FliA/WhiG family RNA polymerase sigma factor [FCB group bacterium]
MEDSFDAIKAFELFRKTRDMKLREKLLMHYLHLARQVAGRMIISLPKSVELEELVSAGMMGLVKAIDRFDLSVGVKFETYAIPRIKGAVFDSLREMDWAPRSIRAKARQVENAVQKLTGRLGRSPEDNELAKEMGIDLDGLYQILDDTSMVTLMSLDDHLASKQGDNVSLFELVEADESDGPVFGVERDELKKATVKAIKNLSEQERLVIALYYYEELTLKEIGVVLEISESRVSQIHTKAILSLRAQLSAALPV